MRMALAENVIKYGVGILNRLEEIFSNYLSLSLKLINKVIVRDYGGFFCGVV